jgi:hypothetical protein
MYSWENMFLQGFGGTLARPRLRCDTNIKIGLTDIGKDGVD